MFLYAGRLLAEVTGMWAFPEAAVKVTRGVGGVMDTIPSFE